MAIHAVFVVIASEIVESGLEQLRDSNWGISVSH